MDKKNLTADNASNPQIQPTPVFIRMPSRGKRELWPGSGLNYWKLRYLVSPCPQNNGTPPVRAYVLCKTGSDRGTVLIEHADLIEWRNKQFQRQNPNLPTLPLPQQPPPHLTIPASGAQCPYTQLRHTVMYQLSLPQSPYGQTQIYFTHLVLPGRTTGPIAMTTDSLFEFIRKCPPPVYRFTPGKFSGK